MTPDDFKIEEKPERFNLLLEALKEFQSRFFNVGYTTFGLMIGALGWLISSEDSRALFAKSEEFRNASYLTLILCVAGFGMGAFRIFWISNRISESLKAVKYFGNPWYGHYKITLPAVVGFIIGHAVAALLIGYCISLTPKLAKDPDRGSAAKAVAASKEKN